jgi:hypothetical protein
MMLLRLQWITRSKLPARTNVDHPAQCTDRALSLVSDNWLNRLRRKESFRNIAQALFKTSDNLLNCVSVIAS